MRQVGHLTVPSTASIRFERVVDENQIHFSSTIEQTSSFLSWWQSGKEGQTIIQSLSAKDLNLPKADHSSSLTIPRVPIVINTSPLVSHGTKHAIPITHTGIWQQNILNHYGPAIYGPSVLNSSSKKSVPTTSAVLQLSYDRYGRSLITENTSPIQASISSYGAIPLYINLKEGYTEEIKKNTGKPVLNKPYTALPAVDQYSTEKIHVDSNKYVDSIFEMWEDNIKQSFTNLKPQSGVTPREELVSSLSNVRQNLVTLQTPETFLNKSLDHVIPEKLGKITNSPAMLIYCGSNLPKGNTDLTVACKNVNGSIIKNVGVSVVEHILNSLHKKQDTLESAMNSVQKEIEQNYAASQVSSKIVFKKTPSRVSVEPQSPLTTDKFNHSFDNISNIIETSISEGVQAAKKDFSVGDVLHGLDNELARVHKETSAGFLLSDTNFSNHYIGSLASIKNKIKNKFKAAKNAVRAGGKEAKESFKRTSAQNSITKAEKKKKEQEEKIAKHKALIDQSKGRSTERVNGPPPPPSDVPPPPPKISMLIGGEIFMPRDDYADEEYIRDLDKSEHHQCVQDGCCGDRVIVPDVKILDPNLATPSEQKEFKKMKRKDIDRILRPKGSETLVVIVETKQGEPGEPALATHLKKKEEKKKTDADLPFRTNTLDDDDNVNVDTSFPDSDLDSGIESKNDTVLDAETNRDEEGMNESPRTELESGSQEEDENQELEEAPVNNFVGCSVCNGQQKCTDCNECDLCCRRKGNGFLCYKWQPAARVTTPNTRIKTFPPPKIETPVVKEPEGFVGSGVDTEILKPSVTLKRLSEKDALFDGVIGIFGNSYTYFKNQVNSSLQQQTKNQKNIIFLNSDEKFQTPKSPNEFIESNITTMTGGTKVEGTDVFAGLEGKNGVKISLIHGTISHPNVSEPSMLSSIFKLHEFDNNIFVTMY